MGVGSSYATLCARYLNLFGNIKYYLRVAVDRVSHPATGLHLIGIESPELELLLEERAADMRRVVQLAGPVVIEDLREDARVPVEKVFVEDRVVVDERLGQPRQSRGRDLFQRRLVRLEADPAHVQHNPVLSVHGHLFIRRRACTHKHSIVAPAANVNTTDVI